MGGIGAEITREFGDYLELGFTAYAQSEVSGAHEDASGHEYHMESGYSAVTIGFGYRCTGSVNLELPEAILQEATTDQQGRRHMRLLLHSPDNAETMLAIIRTEGQIIGASIAGEKIQGPAPESPLAALNLGIYGSTAGEGVELNILLESPAPLEIFLEDHRYSLPEIEGFDVTPRPDWMMPSPTFVSDATVARHTIGIE